MGLRENSHRAAEEASTGVRHSTACSYDSCIGMTMVTRHKGAFMPAGKGADRRVATQLLHDMMSRHATAQRT